MIEDPIVIRKSRGNLIVSAVKSTDPIQLVRQTDPTTLEVHLKNGSKYIEKVTEEELEEVILELMGYRIETLLISFWAWPDNEEGEVPFVESEMLVDSACERLVNSIFQKVPYMHSKFVWGELEIVDEIERKLHYSTYIKRNVVVLIKFWCRVDMLDEVLGHLEEDPAEYATMFAQMPSHRVNNQDFEFSFVDQDQE